MAYKPTVKPSNNERLHAMIERLEKRLAEKGREANSHLAQAHVAGRELARVEQERDTATARVGELQRIVRGLIVANVLLVAVVAALVAALVLGTP